MNVIIALGIHVFLLSRWIEYYKGKNQKVAVIMNELGEVNLDGLMIEEHIPMAEMMASCRMSVSFNKWPVMIHAAVSSFEAYAPRSWH